MSYILDALKKLENEKSKMSRSDGVINISGALFENEQPKYSSMSYWKITLTALVSILIATCSTWLFLNPKAVEKKAATHFTEQSPPISRSKIETVSTSIRPSVDPVQKPFSFSHSVTSRISPVKSAVPSEKSKEPVEKSLAVTGDAATVLTLQELRKRITERRGQIQVLPATQTIAAPADIKLSGIAWQDERLSRRAVVNGHLMQEGGVVLGARIMDIFKDRVRFSLSGKIFEILVVSSDNSEVGK